ncbi:oxidoreductase [Polyplosphaeria fusca]|uniref:Oxidoreductase n=1 Tax=Polyplosphaeria fusca TaxID=682080 RepID=A0A9P4QLB7_9PLEO|nr:oxidoreductase [Polyplosphaeria fusca]
MAPKYVLITGCSAGGIGHGLALAFQKRGCAVIATARNPSKMEDLKPLPNMHLLPLDVTQEASIAAAAKSVEAITGGRLDVLVNNAGGLYNMPILDIDIAAAKNLYDLNLWGPIRMVQTFSDMLIAARGTVVNVGSIAGVLPLPLQSIYNSSKAAINSVSEALRYELAPFGVEVYTSLAGNVKSNIVANTAKIVVPPESKYAQLQPVFDKDPPQYSDMPTAQFCNEIADEVLAGKGGPILKGGNTWIIKWLLPIMPQFVFDRLMMANSRGLDQMPKM